MDSKLPKAVSGKAKYPINALTRYKMRVKPYAHINKVLRVCIEELVLKQLTTEYRLTFFMSDFASAYDARLVVLSPSATLAA